MCGGGSCVRGAVCEGGCVWMLVDYYGHVVKGRMWNGIWNDSYKEHRCYNRVYRMEGDTVQNLVQYEIDLSNVVLKSKILLRP